MDKTLMGMVAAIGAAAPLAGAHAAVSYDEASRALQVNSVAELLDPVPNSAAILHTLDAAASQQAAAPEKNVELAQFFYHHHHHHNWYHHHHHQWYHHHHHHHWYHHHHHHHYYYHHHHHHYYRPQRECFYSPLGYICP